MNPTNQSTKPSRPSNLKESKEVVSTIEKDGSVTYLTK